jgi:hypothetical protein
MASMKNLSAAELIQFGYDLDFSTMEATRQRGLDQKLMALTLIWGHGVADDQVGDVDGPGGHLFRVAQWTVKTDERGNAGYVRHETVEEAMSRLANHPANDDGDSYSEAPVLGEERELTLEVTIRTDVPLLDAIREVHERLAQVGGNWSVEDVVGVTPQDDYEHESGDGLVSEPVDVGDMLTNDGVGRPPVREGERCEHGYGGPWNSRPCGCGRPPIPVGEPIHATIGAPVPAGRAALEPVDGPRAVRPADVRRVRAAEAVQRVLRRAGGRARGPAAGGRTRAVPLLRAPVREADPGEPGGPDRDAHVRVRRLRLPGAVGTWIPTRPPGSPSASS